MIESGYYPPGAEHDPNAPYNQTEQEEREIDIEAVFELRRKVTISTRKYDENGNCDGESEYKQVCFTPLQLIAECRLMTAQVLSMIEKCEHTSVGKRIAKHLRHIIAECDGWETSYEEFN